MTQPTMTLEEIIKKPIDPWGSPADSIRQLALHVQQLRIDQQAGKRNPIHFFDGETYAIICGDESFSDPDQGTNDLSKVTCPRCLELHAKRQPASGYSPERHDGDWIPIEDGYPPEAIEALLCCQQGAHQWQTVGHFTNRKWHGHDTAGVTHWRRLPMYPNLTPPQANAGEVEKNGRGDLLRILDAALSEAMAEAVRAELAKVEEYLEAIKDNSNNSMWKPALNAGIGFVRSHSVLVSQVI